MRRLVPALIVFVSLLALGAAGAVAAKSKPQLTLTGSAHASDGKLRGSFTVKNVGTARAPALDAKVKLVGSGRKPTRLTVQHASVHALAPGAKQQVKVKATVPKKAASGTWSIVACAGGCVKIGKLAAAGGGPERGKPTSPTAPATPTTSGPGPSPTPTPTPTTPNPVCAPAGGPLGYTVEEPFRHVGECGVEYFGFVPASYDAGVPMPLLIWMHGCGGEAEGDAWTVGSYEGEAPKGWLALSLGGRDGDCWNPLAPSEALVMAALADFEAHFDVDRHRVILGGYSSGGDLAYRTGFRHSSTFAGLLIENSSPFRDTESTQAESLAAATTKFHVVHLAHTGDTSYPIATVREETEAVQNAGFPLQLIEKPGEHFDAHTDSICRHSSSPTSKTAGRLPRAAPQDLSLADV